MTKGDAIKTAKACSKSQDGVFVAYYDDDDHGYQVFQYFYGAFDQMDLRECEVVAAYSGGQFYN